MRGAAPGLRVPGGMTAAVMVVIGALALTASSAAAQSGTPYLPSGYGAGATTYVASTTPAATPPAVRTTSIRGLWIPGLIGLPVAWIASWVHASLSLSAGSEGVDTSFIPVVGPWLVLASQNVDTAYYVTAGLVQDISLICLVLGLVIRVPEPRARIALGPSLPVLEVAASPNATGGAMSASVQF